MNTNDRYRKCILDIETTSFIPWDGGRIICIGIKDIESGEIVIFYDENEETLLIRFFQYFNKMNFCEIIGYNISFDIRFIFSRCLRFRLPSYGFFTVSHVDLMMILKGVTKGFNYNQPGSLNDWTKFIFNKKKLFENTEIPALYQQRKLSEILEYNRHDVELTYELWKRIMLVLHGEQKWT